MVEKAVGTRHRYILAAVAGIGDSAMAEDMTMEQWDHVLNINLRGVWIFDQLVEKAFDHTQNTRKRC